MEHLKTFLYLVGTGDRRMAGPYASKTRLTIVPALHRDDVEAKIYPLTKRTLSPAETVTSPRSRVALYGT